MKSTSWAMGLSVSGDGVGVVAHAGGVAVRLLADQVGLTRELSGALSRRGFVPGHDRGQVLVDVATMLAGGGEAIADIDTLRHQEEVLGAVASPPTVWRALDELTRAGLKRVEKARARTRARVWELAGGPPAVRAAGRTLDPDLVVLDVDATIVVATPRRRTLRPRSSAPSGSIRSVSGATVRMMRRCPGPGLTRGATGRSAFVLICRWRLRDGGFLGR